jgi:hypothetical protein
VGATGTYVDRPTITYTPIMGDKFARSLMSPIPPPAILSLLQAGYPVDLIFRLLVQEINGIRNRFGGEARAQSADPEFYSLIEKLRDRRKRDRSHCDGSYQLSKAAVGRGSERQRQYRDSDKGEGKAVGALIKHEGGIRT